MKKQGKQKKHTMKLDDRHREQPDNGCRYSVEKVHRHDRRRTGTEEIFLHQDVPPKHPYHFYVHFSNC